MKTRTKVILAVSLTIGCCAGVVFFLFRYPIIRYADMIITQEYELPELTMEEKLEDFEEFYTTIVESAPYLEEVKELYGIDFVGRKEYYIEEIKSTKNNVEFFAVMTAIARDVTSFHTNIGFPLYSYLQEMNCYNVSKTFGQFGLKEKIDAWTEEIGNVVKEYTDVNTVCVSYVDGKYVLLRNDTWNEMVSIDGILADEYLVQNISMYSLHYDYKWDKAYREYFILNDSVGQKVKVVWRNQEGQEFEEDWYVDYGAVVAHGFGHIYSNKEKPEVVSAYNFMTYRDDENQIEYIKINNFSNSKGMKLREYLENVSYDRIVIDMRNNGGGRFDYPQKYIYPALYGLTIDYSFKWRVPNTQVNRAMIDELMVSLYVEGTKKDDFYYYEETRLYEGQQSEKREIYYLIGPGTGSAADGFIAFIKENNLGTIVGTATGGEGLGASFIMDTLENSSLVYTFYPAEYVDTEQTNPCAGVVPDVYLNQNLEDYRLELECIWDGTEQEYENRLKYDTLLKWVINQE